MAATSDRTAARKGAALYFVGALTAQACALLRYLVLARLLGPGQLGLAAILTLTVAFFGLITDTGGDRFLIQSRDGDKPSVQGMVQLVLITRGVLAATVMVAAAWPIAMLYRAPELVGGLVALAIPLVLSGFFHLDMRRYQRKQDFRSEGIALLASEPLSVVATVTAALITHGFSAIVYGLITRWCVFIVVSHLRSERPFAVSIDRAHFAQLLGFSAPLMLNGFLLFLGSQSDRVIIGRVLSLRELGLYSAVSLLIYYPSSMALQYMGAMYLPLVSSSRSEAARRSAADLMGGQAILLALLMSSGFTLTMPFIVPILYGAKFAQPTYILALIGVLQTSRFLIVWPNTVAMGGGRSSFVLYSNLVRLIGLPIAILGAHLKPGLDVVAAAFIVGEWVAVSFGVRLTHRRIGHGPLASFGRLGSFFLASALVVAWPLAISSNDTKVEGVLAVATVAVVAWLLGREKTTLVGSFGQLRGMGRAPAAVAAPP